MSDFPRVSTFQKTDKNLSKVINKYFVADLSQKGYRTKSSNNTKNFYNTGLISINSSRNILQENRKEDKRYLSEMKSTLIKKANDYTKEQLTIIKNSQHNK